MDRIQLGFTVLSILALILGGLAYLAREPKSLKKTRRLKKEQRSFEEEKSINIRKKISLQS